MRTLNHLLHGLYHGNTYSQEQAEAYARQTQSILNKPIYTFISFEQASTPQSLVNASLEGLFDFFKSKPPTVQPKVLEYSDKIDIVRKHTSPNPQATPFLSTHIPFKTYSPNPADFIKQVNIDFDLARTYIRAESSRIKPYLNWATTAWKTCEKIYTTHEGRPDLTEVVKTFLLKHVKSRPTISHVPLPKFKLVEGNNPAVKLLEPASPPIYTQMKDLASDAFDIGEDVWAVESTYKGEGFDDYPWRDDAMIHVHDLNTTKPEALLFDQHSLDELSILDPIGQVDAHVYKIYRVLTEWMYQSVK